MLEMKNHLTSSYFIAPSLNKSLHHRLKQESVPGSMSLLDNPHTDALNHIHHLPFKPFIILFFLCGTVDLVQSARNIIAMVRPIPQ